MGVSSVCVEEGERRSEEELGARRRSVGRSVGRRSAAGAAPKVRTPHNDVGNNKDAFQSGTYWWLNKKIIFVLRENYGIQSPRHMLLIWAVFNRLPTFAKGSCGVRPALLEVKA